MKNPNYKLTVAACCITSMTQAITLNLSPMFFVVFNEQFGINLTKISLLITLNFIIQLFMDLTAPLYVDRVGYRACIIFGMVASIIGIAALGMLPLVLENRYIALLISSVVCAIGGGIIEVVTSPVVDALPGESKRGSICLLHSFYCWGHAAVILFSTLYIFAFGIDKWFYLPLIWCVVPLTALVMFTFVPIRQLSEVNAHSSTKKLLREGGFWLLLIVMICAGAAEQGMAQWASMFIQKALGISKSLGDLFGPFIFAVCMGTGRIMLSVFGKRIRLERWLLGSFALSALCYILAAVSPLTVLSLVACGLMGVGVAILWPATLSLGEERLMNVSTAMFAYFALAGDVGCTLGPDIIGMVSDAVIASGGSSMLNIFGGDPISAGMKLGMLLATVFPLLACIVIPVFSRVMKRKEKPSIHIDV